MIEVENDHYRKPYLVVNGRELPASIGRKKGDGPIWVIKITPETARGLTNVTSADVSHDIRRIGIIHEEPNWTVHIDVARAARGGRIRRLRAMPATLKWVQPFGIADYFAEARRINEEEQFGFHFGKRGGEYWRMKDLDSDSRSLAQIFHDEYEDRQNLDSAVIEHLTATLRPDAVVTLFRFPREIKTACEQYLLHFVDFLRDLGVEADADLAHSTGKVLFTVTPKNHEDALDRIREALEIYVRLPSARVVSFADSREEQLALKTLEMNIHFLQGQLANAEAKNLYLTATIETQRVTIDALKLLASGEVIGHPRNASSGEPDKREEIFGGVVELTKYKGEGFEIDLAELYRRLKRRFSKD